MATQEATTAAGGGTAAPGFNPDKHADGIIADVLPALRTILGLFEQISASTSDGVVKALADDGATAADVLLDGIEVRAARAQKAGAAEHEAVSTKLSHISSILDVLVMAGSPPGGFGEITLSNLFWTLNCLTREAAALVSTAEEGRAPA